MSDDQFNELLTYLKGNPEQAKELVGVLLPHIYVDICRDSGYFDDLGNRSGPDPIEITLMVSQ